ncbi:MAG TPA: RNA 2',3'-cyclic phosphodiesterase [Terriglobia bacterium]|nr:RNA 2',3'-cyclic phosphodiesterase [Terriglobia bacterium]
MRAFIAIELPARIQEELGRRQEEFRKRLSASARDREISWTRAGNIHLTLKFLGDISKEQLNRVAGQLDSIPPFEKFGVEVRGFGFFPNAKRPRVFWAGLVGPSALGELSTKIEAAASKAGFSPEERPFEPHLTLARLRNPQPFPDVSRPLPSSGEDSMGQFDVTEFHLFESTLHSRAPAEYRKIGSYPPSAKLS